MCVCVRVWVGAPSDVFCKVVLIKRFQNWPYYKSAHDVADQRRFCLKRCLLTPFSLRELLTYWQPLPTPSKKQRRLLTPFSLRDLLTYWQPLPPPPSKKQRRLLTPFSLRDLLTYWQPLPTPSKKQRRLLTPFSLRDLLTYWQPLPPPPLQKTAPFTYSFQPARPAAILEDSPGCETGGGCGGAGGAVPLFSWT